MVFKPADHLPKQDKSDFEFAMSDGTVFTLKSPKKMKAAQVVELSSNSLKQTLQAQLGDSYETVIAYDEVTLEWVEALLEAYNEYYDLGAPGEGSAS